MTETTLREWRQRLCTSVFPAISQNVDRICREETRQEFFSRNSTKVEL